MDLAMARHLGDLAPADHAAAHHLAETRGALALSVMRETERLSEEKKRLETLLFDVPVGVLLCSSDDMLAFYNSQASDLMATGQAPGLGRKLFDYLREGPVRHAHDRLIATGDPDAATDLFCTSMAGTKVLSARMRLTPGAQGAGPGYVLTLRDVTSDLSTHARREALLSEVFDRLRRPAANLTTLLAVIPEGEAGPGPLDAALRQKVSALALGVNELSRRH
jgi:DNA polymerase III subunit epsilon